MGTFVSILLGTLIGGWIITIKDGTYILGFLMIAMALIGWISSHQIPTAPPVSKELTTSLNPFKEISKNFHLASQDKTVWYCILTISWFWLYGG